MIDDDALFERLRLDAELILAALDASEWGDAVPGLEWTVGDVVVHTGAVHRWSADIVRRALPSNESGGSRAFHPDLTDTEPAAWFAEGTAALLDALRAAPVELSAWTFARGVPARRFWLRRQAHETAIHRVDVQAARGAVTDVDPEFAQDGIDELAAGFARQRAFATDEIGTLSVVASDGPSWLIRFGGERIEAGPDEDADFAGDAMVSGTSSELYYWLWNRPSSVSISGDESVAALWGRQVRI